MTLRRTAITGLALLTSWFALGAGSGAAKPTVSTAAAPIVVMVTGNSEAGTLTYGAPLGQGPHGLSAQPGITIVDKTILACSISSAPEFVLASGEHVANQCGGKHVWQERYPADVASVRPDVVFLMAGDRDVYDVARPDGTVIHPGDPSWSVAYTADVKQLFQILRATGAPVVAIRPPCYGFNTLAPDEPQVSERLDPVRAKAVTLAWQAAARAVGVRLLDLDEVICPGGVADPSIRADGVHFGPAGADQLAPTITRALRTAVPPACPTSHRPRHRSCASTQKHAASMRGPAAARNFARS